MTNTNSDFSAEIQDRLLFASLCRSVRQALRASSPSLAVLIVGVGASASLVLAPPAAAFPANFPLVRLMPRAGGDGTEGFVIQGIAEGDRLGTLHVSGAGDVNGDGITDLVLGSPYADSDNRPNAGEAYVIFGRDADAGFPPVFPLTSLLPRGGGNGTAGFVLQGIDSYDLCGYSVKDAGDVNGDGIGDLIIGALRADPEDRPRAGEAYVVFGRSSGFPPVMQLASLISGDGSEGFVLQGVDPYDELGRQASGAGDVNGDGIDDIVIGAAHADPGDRESAGETYVVFGSTRGFPPTFPLATLFPDAGGDGTAGFVLDGIGAEDVSGLWATAAGDVNGDGIGDLIIGARYADDGDRLFVGEGYVVFGRTAFPPIFPLARLLPPSGGDGSLGFVLRGIDPYDFAGVSVGATDINGDGLSDVIISADGADPGGRTYAGETYVVFGRDTSEVGNFPPLFLLANLLPGAGGNGSEGFVMTGVDAYDLTSFSLSGTPDVNGDGIDDLTVGAPRADRGNRIDAGEAYVVFGRNGPAGAGFPAVLPLSSLFPDSGGDGTEGFVLGGIDAYDNAGRNGAAGDINGDGINDLVIAAEAADPGGRTDAGEVYIVFGRAD